MTQVQPEVPMTGVIFDVPNGKPAAGLSITPTPPQLKSHDITTEEKIVLADRVNPTMPVSVNMQDYTANGTYADGFEHIDQLSVMECVLSPFQAMDEVPKQYREVFAKSMETILRRIYENQEEGEELDRALKWWFFIPQALLRKARRGGSWNGFSEKAF